MTNSAQRCCGTRHAQDTRAAATTHVDPWRRRRLMDGLEWYYEDFRFLGMQAQGEGLARKTLRKLEGSIAISSCRAQVMAPSIGMHCSDGPI